MLNGVRSLLPLAALAFVMLIALPWYEGSAASSGPTERVSVIGTGNEGDDASYNASISADGRYVAFESDATNLAPADTNLVSDVFVRDRVAGTTERVSVDSSVTRGTTAATTPRLVPTVATSPSSPTLPTGAGGHQPRV